MGENQLTNTLKGTRKSYNPFKMWGSWVGAIALYFFLPKLIPLLSLTEFLFKVSDCKGIGCWAVGAYAMLFASLVIGFLLGWAIHSLVRRLRR